MLYFKIWVEFLFPYLIQGTSNGGGDSSVSAPGEGTHPSRNLFRTYTIPRKNVHGYNLRIALEQNNILLQHAMFDFVTIYNLYIDLYKALSWLL